ncbi:MAG: hypothetical protein NWQ55_04450 [Salibacteraceae bacterium]|jgi:hypothetical protein|nr:hypothetical protein [Salibacteraceae bacterium]
MKSNSTSFVLAVVFILFAQTIFAQDIIKLKLNVPKDAHILVSNSEYINMDIVSVDGKIKLELESNELYELKVEKEGFVPQVLSIDTRYENFNDSSLGEFTIHLYAKDELMEHSGLKSFSIKEELNIDCLEPHTIRH